MYGRTIEKNANVERPVSIDGNDYDSDTIASWSQGAGATQLAAAFGEDFKEQFQSDPAVVLESLPVTHKQAIARMIDESR